MGKRDLIGTFENLNNHGAFTATLQALRNNQFFTAAQLARIERSWLSSSYSADGRHCIINCAHKPDDLLRDVDRAITSLDRHARGKSEQGPRS